MKSWKWILIQDSIHIQLRVFVRAEVKKTTQQKLDKVTQLPILTNKEQINYSDKNVILSRLAGATQRNPV